MEDNQASTTESNAPMMVGLGERFREARKQGNFSIEDVAAHLRLTCQLVQDIESDNYAEAKRHLVFVRGYLRAYAKLVGLSADEVITSFNMMNVSDAQIEKPSWQTQAAEEFERDERNNWLAFVALSLIMLFGAVIWWSTQHYDFSKLSAFIKQSEATLADNTQVTEGAAISGAPVQQKEDAAWKAQAEQAVSAADQTLNQTADQTASISTTDVDLAKKTESTAQITQSVQTTQRSAAETHSNRMTARKATSARRAVKLAEKKKKGRRLR